MQAYNYCASSCTHIFSPGLMGSHNEKNPGDDAGKQLILLYLYTCIIDLSLWQNLMKSLIAVNK